VSNLLRGFAKAVQITNGIQQHSCKPSAACSTLQGNFPCSFVILHCTYMPGS
jgi:hypothetical protein